MAESNTATIEQARKRPMRSKLARREARWALTFISPWIIGFLAFTLLPMLASLVFSFLDLDPSVPDQVQFVGLDNWERLMFTDPEVKLSYLRLAKLAIGILPVTLIGSFFLAVLLNSRYLMGIRLFRTLFYLPAMIPVVSAALIWNGVLNEYSGWINIFITRILGLEGLRWMTDKDLIYITYTLVSIWGISNAMIVFLAGLQNVPTELYDAATVDGAGWWHRLFHITIPMISPVIFQQLVLAAIGMVQFFLLPFVLNGGTGDPEGSTRFPMVWFYRQAFTFQNMGYGAALAWMLFAVALILTIIIFATAKYWVYYAGERE